MMPWWWVPLGVLWTVGCVLYPLCGWLRALLLVRDLARQKRPKKRAARRKVPARR